MPTFIDIPVPLQSGIASDPPGFPTRLKGGSAGWTRAVAILDGDGAS